jgi:hypothetical protein
VDVLKRVHEGPNCCSPYYASERRSSNQIQRAKIVRGGGGGDVQIYQNCLAHFEENNFLYSLQAGAENSRRISVKL